MRQKEVPQTEHIYRLGELFCGPGGLAYGALHASVPGQRIVHAWANDFDKDTCETYRHNICPTHPETVICKDVRQLTIKKGVLSDIDAFAFGFPCNDFSLVGEHKGLDGKYGALYTYGIKVLQEFQPLWFIAENVGGLHSANDGKALEVILQAMETSGYKLYPNFYKFEEYGIPQQRHRFIIVGIRKDQKVTFRIPKPNMLVKTCRQAIEIPPIASDAFNNEPTRHAQKVLDRLQYIEPGQNAWNAEIPASLKLHVKHTTLSQIYKRLDPTKPAYTVTGSGGGGTHIYHWSENRALTNRERARLQTFPDDFVFMGSKEKVRRQVGMAVPCEAARIIAEAILKTFAGIEYDFIDSNMPYTPILPGLD